MKAQSLFPLLLLMTGTLAVAGCFGPSSGSATAASFREGDSATYGFVTTSMTFDAQFEGSMDFVWGPKVQSNRALDADGARILEFHRNFVITPPGEPPSNAIRTSQVFHVNTNTLALQGSESNLSIFGVEHRSLSAAFIAGSATGLPFDGTMMPPPAMLTSLPRDREVQVGHATTPARPVFLRVATLPGGYELTGRAIDAAGADALRWTAVYDIDQPFPTNFSLSVMKSRTIQAQFQPNEAFSMHGALVDFTKGTGDPIRQTLQAPPSPETGEPSQAGTWVDALSARSLEGAIPYPLHSAWADAERNASALVGFLATQELPFPARIEYRAVRTNEFSMDFEWNFTFCGENGSCASGVVGKRLLPGNLALHYVADGDGHDDSGGLFTGPTFALERQERMLGVAALELPFRIFSESNPAPIRRVVFDPAQVGPHLDGDPSEPAEPVEMVLALSHGTIARQNSRPGLPYTSSSELIQSTFSAMAGRVLALRTIAGDYPQSWDQMSPGPIVESPLVIAAA